MGDDLLRSVARASREAIRGSDISARTGGDVSVPVRGDWAEGAGSLGTGGAAGGNRFEQGEETKALHPAGDRKLRKARQKSRDELFFLLPITDSFVRLSA
jgi:hypothetical protein